MKTAGFNRTISLMLLMMTMLVFYGCYTTIASKKLSKSEWRKTHSYQYFSGTEWGKQWNSYYWSPTSLGFPSSSTDSPEAKHKRKYSRADYWSDECTDACASGCKHGCIWSLLDAIFENHDNDDDDGGNGENEPPRRRGTEASENDTTE